MTLILARKICNQLGFVTKEDNDELQKTNPTMPVVIRWGCAPREVTISKNLDAKIADGTKRNPSDYVRDCFISADNVAALRKEFNLNQGVNKSLAI